MDESVKECRADAERQPAVKTAEQELQEKYKQVGINAVFAAANYVKLSRPRRAA